MDAKFDDPLDIDMKNTEVIYQLILDDKDLIEKIKKGDRNAITTITEIVTTVYHDNVYKREDYEQAALNTYNHLSASPAAFLPANKKAVIGNIATVIAYALSNVRYIKKYNLGVQIPEENK
jgi:hypothetical protein